MQRRAGRRERTTKAEELVLRTIATHAESLLLTARRHSLCDDDAQDAYQRAMEIFMRNADRLESGRAAAWLTTVIRNEALDIRRARKEDVGPDDVDLDLQEAPDVLTFDERTAAFDMVCRSAEALQRLKPQELRALWLKAQGHSYSDIGEITGWSYTKVNRCLTEGRRSFLERYAGIESGQECETWAPMLSAIIDGEASAEQMAEVRPHLRHCGGCRATLRSLQETRTPVAAVLPVPLVVAAESTLEETTSVFVRLYEGVVGGLHERAIGSATKLQAAVEASMSGKVAAVAASAAAVAGGGYATVETVAPKESKAKPVAEAKAPSRSAPKKPVARVTKPVAATKPAASKSVTPKKKATAKTSSGGSAPEFPSSKKQRAAEFGNGTASAASTSVTPVSAAPAPAPKPAPEFSKPAASPEFGP